MNAEQHRPIKVLIAKTSLDGHIRGVIVVSRALRDDVWRLFMANVNSKEIITTAIEEDVDVIGLNIGGVWELSEESWI